MHQYEVIKKIQNLMFDYTNDDPETLKHTNDAWNVQMMPKYTESNV